VGEPTAWSKYQSAQFTVQKRFSHGFSLLANYTIAKSIDISSYATIEGNSAGPDPFNFNNNRGLSDFDTPQRLVVSGIVEHPRSGASTPVVRGIIGGWQSNFIFIAQSGTPFGVASGVDNALMGIGGNRADLTGESWVLPEGRSRGEQILAWFSPKAFKINAVGTIGQLGRNTLRAAGAWNTDYSLFKDFNLVERARLQFRGEFFNLLQPYPAGRPQRHGDQHGFGRISSAYEPRIVQLGLKVIF